MKSPDLEHGTSLNTQQNVNGQLDTKEPVNGQLGTKEPVNGQLATKDPVNEAKKQANGQILIASSATISLPSVTAEDSNNDNDKTSNSEEKRLPAVQ